MGDSEQERSMGGEVSIQRGILGEAESGRRLLGHED